MRAFFSYSREDSPAALQLAQTLRQRGVDLWVDRFDIPPGAPFRQAIDQALNACDALLVVLTPRSALSQEVEAEWNSALGDRKRVLPVILEACRVPRRLAVLQCTDLSTGDEAELIRLVNALTSGATAVGDDAATEARAKVTRASAAPRDGRPPLTRGRGRGAAAGLTIGAAYGVVSALAVYTNDPRHIVSQSVLVFGPLAAAFGGVAGAFAGARGRALMAIAAAVAATGIAWTIAFGTYADVVMTGLVVGGGVTAIIVAVLWPRIERRLDGPPS